LTDYVGVAGTNFEQKDGVLFLDSTVCMADVVDGTSNTVMLGERPPSPDSSFGWWYAGHGQVRKTVIQRTGRLTQPRGQLTLTFCRGRLLKKRLLQILDELESLAA